MAEENTINPVPEQSPSAGTNKKRIIQIAIALAALIALLVGYFIWSSSSEQEKLRQAEMEASPEYQLRKQLEFRKENKPPRFIKMEEFTVNLPGRGGEHYLQASMVLRTGDQATDRRVQEFLPIIRDKVIQVLSSRPMDQLATVEGKTILAKEVALVINSIIEPQLTAIYILQQRYSTEDLRNLERIGVMPQQSTAGQKLTQAAVEAAAQYWTVTEMDLPVQAVLFDKFVMQ
jgi:flagellar protein FliL